MEPVHSDIGSSAQSKPKSTARAILELLIVSTKLGLTSFGGPIAHLGYFHNEYVRHRRWLDERAYSELVALCQFLPGPASSQVGIGIGIIRGGLLGGFVAWLGFTLPSVIALVLFAYLLQGFDLGNAGFIHGLKIVAVAIVAQAVIGMGQKLAPDKIRATVAVVAASAALLWQAPFAQLIIIASAGLFGLAAYRQAEVSPDPNVNFRISRTTAVISLTIFFALLALLPLLSRAAAGGWLPLFDSFYRSGSLVFGGGHVVLPLLEREVVPAGLISKENFLAGYGAAQAVPGPLFTFAAYLGAMINGVFGAFIATAAIFLPAFLLVVGTLPFYGALRKNPVMQGAMIGMNAAVVGILLAALYNPLWTTAIKGPAEFALAAILFIMLQYWKLPPWIVVAAGIVGGTVLSILPH